MKLSTWAKTQGITYRTAWNWFTQGILPVEAEQLPTGTIIVKERTEKREDLTESNIVIYGRVSSRDRKQSLNNQIERCLEYCAAKGYSVLKIYKEIASGMNDSRKELTKMLETKPDIIVVENKDRLTRFGFNYLKILLEQRGCKIEVLNNDSTDEHDLMKDMISFVTSFCCRLYGLRRGQNKAKRITEEIQKLDD